MKIVFATAEVSPIAKTGGLGDVCGSLPKALAALGHEVFIFMPYYRQAMQWFAKNGQSVYPAHQSTSLSWGNWTRDLNLMHSVLPGTDIPLYLVANDDLFNRDYIYSARWDGHQDALERFTYFCRAVVRGCELLGIAPDIVHAHDWHAALLPVYLHSGLRGSEQFRSARSVYTIHNLNYQGVTSADQFGLLGLHSRYWAADALEHFGDINPMKGGIIFADQVTTVSPNYAREIQTHAHGAGLDGLLRSLSFKLEGILNGIDVEEWDPSTDVHIPQNYTADDLSGKDVCRTALEDEAGFAHDDRPIIGVISRLVEQKGFQLLWPVLPKLVQAGARFFILGSGEDQLERQFEQLAARFPDSVRTWIGFDNNLAHRIYAGADMILMPSIYEPCGLNQMYALRYGTVPVVRLTGGLKDTVIPFDGTNLDDANGFGFTNPDPEHLYGATWTAMLNRHDRETWKQLQVKGMRADFSWDRSAREYESVYRRALVS